MIADVDLAGIPDVRVRNSAFVHSLDPGGGRWVQNDYGVTDSKLRCVIDGKSPSSNRYAGRGDLSTRAGDLGLEVIVHSAARYDDCGRRCASAPQNGVGRRIGAIADTAQYHTALVEPDGAVDLIGASC